MDPVWVSLKGEGGNTSTLNEGFGADTSHRLDLISVKTKKGKMIMRMILIAYISHEGLRAHDEGIE
jgi:hypothetical protein